MKRFAGFVVLIVLQLGTAVGWLAYGLWEGADPGENRVLHLELSAEERQMQENLALWYNLNLTSTGEGQPLEGYEKILFFEDGLMCSVEFLQGESILPVWHGASEKRTGGLTHLSRSALPIGGKGNHTVLTCREADLGDMALPECGDDFVVHALGKIMSYRIVDVNVTKETLNAPEGETDKDLCSIWIRRQGDWVIIRAEREYPQGQKGENIS